MAQGRLNSLQPTLRALLVAFVLVTSACATRYAAEREHPGWVRANGDEPTEQDDVYGNKVAADLQARYDDSQVDCGGASRPVVLCSGILFRATVSSPDYHAWNPNPNNPKGTVSFSWLRHDAQFESLYLSRYTHGFVLIPLFYADRAGRLDPYYKMEVVCVYPIDADTDRRDRNGCGSHALYPDTSRPCFEMGIDTAAKYVAYYQESPLFAYSCSIPVAIGDAHSAANFTMFIETIRGMGGMAFNWWNELLVREWPQDIHTTIPLEAFFYQSGTGGIDGARLDQIDFRAASGKWLPIIRFNMPATIDDRATFQYVPADQSRMPPGALPEP
ncbi:hypothetical protein SAMN02800694_2425 [Luteibacter sp. UNCMF331Sha3.1]|uniref:hypothetical protein n=1 Tax=Luteibacter sp. UNCMF331Sha3.1 TaxID=1502760 RepID=UPI0008CD6E1C|nr:hypothetical protein [Luteibacter sp. UNCMF331Sha3.1]SEM99787.1 hypothetical protein SAMN02800694_2425 [Luteibacter sp. UNCMF331Sha3.1]